MGCNCRKGGTTRRRNVQKAVIRVSPPKKPRPVPAPVKKPVKE